MNRFSHWVPRYILVILLGCGLWASAWAADGIVLDFRGDVRVNGQPVSNETEFSKGDKITTGPGASVTIMLSDKSVLDIKANSEIDLSDYFYDESDPSKDTAEVGLVEGTLRYVSGLISESDPEKVQFRAGTSTIGVRGSYIHLSHVKDELTAASAIGRVRVGFARGGFCLAEAGQSCTGNPQTGKAVVTHTRKVDEVLRAAEHIAKADPDNPQPSIRNALDKLRSNDDRTMLFAVALGNPKKLGPKQPRKVHRNMALAAVVMDEKYPRKHGTWVSTAFLLSRAACGRCQRDRQGTGGERRQRSGNTGHDN